MYLVGPALFFLFLVVGNVGRNSGDVLRITFRKPHGGLELGSFLVRVLGSRYCLGSSGQIWAAFLWNLYLVA